MTFLSVGCSVRRTAWVWERPLAYRYQIPQTRWSISALFFYSVLFVLHIGISVIIFCVLPGPGRRTTRMSGQQCPSAFDWDKLSASHRCLVVLYKRYEYHFSLACMQRTASRVPICFGMVYVCSIAPLDVFFHLFSYNFCTQLPRGWSLFK